jgi:AAA domain
MIFNMEQIVTTHPCVIQGDHTIDPQLIVIRGLPGSGKSTMATRFKALGYLHIETDMFFYERGRYIFHRARLPEAQKWCELVVHKALKLGRKVVVSNTFILKSEIAPLLVDARSVLIIKATGAWSNIHGVSNDAMEKMSLKWEE